VLSAGNLINIQDQHYC